MDNSEKLKEYHREYSRKNRQRISEQAKALHEEKKAAGFCVCCEWGTPAEPGKTLCLTHLEVRRNRRKEHYEERLRRGLCTSCGKPAVEGKKSCHRCMVNGCKGVRSRGERGKRKIVAYLGGKCQRCGLVTDIMPVYEIHHLTKKNKEFNIKTIRGWSWEAIKKELDKGVQLLCANCHRIIQHSHEENWANRIETP